MGSNHVAVILIWYFLWCVTNICICRLKFLNQFYNLFDSYITPGFSIYSKLQFTGSSKIVYIYICIYIYIYICIYIYIYILYILYIYINVSRKSLKCVYIKWKLRTHFFLQIFQCLYEIFYSVYGSNILQKDILTAIIKSKLNEIKV